MSHTSITNNRKENIYIHHDFHGIKIKCCQSQSLNSKISRSLQVVDFQCTYMKHKFDIVTFVEMSVFIVFITFIGNDHSI